MKNMECCFSFSMTKRTQGRLSLTELKKFFIQIKHIILMQIKQIILWLKQRNWLLAVALRAVK